MAVFDIKRSIKFTFEMENEKDLPFLNDLIKRSCANKLQVDVFRKDSRTHNCIPISYTTQDISSNFWFIDT